MEAKFQRVNQILISTCFLPRINKE